MPDSALEALGLWEEKVCPPDFLIPELSFMRKRLLGITRSLHRSWEQVMGGGAGKNRAQLVHRWKPELHPYKTSAGQAKGGYFSGDSVRPLNYHFLEGKSDCV